MDVNSAFERIKHAMQGIEGRKVRKYQGVKDLAAMSLMRSASQKRSRAREGANSSAEDDPCDSDASIDLEEDLSLDTEVQPKPRKRPRASNRSRPHVPVNGLEGVAEAVGVPLETGCPWEEKLDRNLGVVEDTSLNCFGCMAPLLDIEGGWVEEGVKLMVEEWYKVLGSRDETMAASMVHAIFKKKIQPMCNRKLAEKRQVMIDRGLDPGEDLNDVPDWHPRMIAYHFMHHVTNHETFVREKIVSLNAIISCLNNQIFTKVVGSDGKVRNVVDITALSDYRAILGLQMSLFRSGDRKFGDYVSSSEVVTQAHSQTQGKPISIPASRNSDEILEMMPEV